MRRGRKWTDADHEALQDMWGDFSIPTIAKNLNRSINAIKIKAFKLKLGPHMQSGEYVNMFELLKAIGQEGSYSYLKMRLLRDGLPTVRKKVDKCSFVMVSIDKFWEWTEKNKDKINFAYFEPNMLGAEPDWVKEKRKADYAATKYTKLPWSKRDDEKLINMLNAYEYGYAEISAALRRTEGAIKRRMLDLGLKQRLIKAVPTPWTDAEIALLQELRQKGYGYENIGVKLGRSALSCRARMERLENPEYMKWCNRGQGKKGVS